MSEDLNTEIVAPGDGDTEKHISILENAEVTEAEFLVAAEDREINEETELEDENLPSASAHELEAEKNENDENAPPEADDDDIVLHHDAGEENGKDESRRISLSDLPTVGTSDEDEINPEEAEEISDSLRIRKESLELDDFANIMKDELQESEIDDIFAEEENVENEEIDEKTEGATEDDTDEDTSSLRSLTVKASRPRFPKASITKDFLLMTDIESLNIFEGFDASIGSRSSVASSMGFSTRGEESKIDRNIYYELYALYTNQYQTEKRKNNYFQIKLADYYKRRRMYHVLLTEQNVLADYKKRYEKLLDEFESVNEESAREQEGLEFEMESLKNKCRFRNEELKLLFEKLQKQELEYSKEVMNVADEKGKENAEKFVERYLKRQKIQQTNLTTMRLAFIKLRNKYNETQEALALLNNLGPNLTLMDYEQLKCDNRTLSDKLEEREMDLTAIRAQCENVMQVLAHTREKVDAIDVNIQTFSERLETVTDEFMDVREQVNSMKAERNQLRRLTSKMKDDAGLLTRPHLLKDMEKSIKEVKEGWKQLEQYKQGYTSAQQELEVVRQHLSTHGLSESKRKYRMPKRISFRTSLE